ncbi:hypothetical protein TREMEDRAFT_60039 [Tremella mesenterica DSM 1558]|uniref:uncharacterized protein n=1 Tax=Tremella mesenterica (strain ATCC 24925 / CBS 8224 / DSM 1558 / NBRC 9311 / NRRL Y-6157 / RJB 2259-6 / UBC 559-6) TaxID=578456 RepID=UPI0003F48E37|nr:uncharacterized protein TREMEDRAFT_60039 [Tremella mesenterica DSM 1558]EIW71099.1 hypothetical protein TREMEDRAFT_60039 [Tremella mesenterica DSM 1558]
MTIPSNFLTATETIALINDGKLTVTQLALDHFARYEARDAEVEAWAYINKDHILKEAKRLDDLPKEKRGPLHGMILGVKDMINTYDLPTQHNSPIYKGHQPGVDAAPVAVCRALGALIYGKTHTTEFASTGVGPPAHNAYDPARTPGGSSSGSGAAVGDYQCQIAFGTQTGGSTIRPGSFNNIFAMKPTWSAISREGLKIFSVTLDTLGLYSRSVSDLQLLAYAFRLIDDVPPPLTPKPLSECTFGYTKTHSWYISGGPSPELIRAYETSKEILLSAGAKIEEFEMPPEFNDLALLRNRYIMAGEGRAAFLPEYVANRWGLSDQLASHVENKQFVITRQMQLQAYDEIAALRPIVDGMLGKYDAVVTPSVPGEAPIGLGSTGDARFCSMWTALHVPCVQIPGFASENGMPIGLTLVGPRYHDQKLLSTSKAVAAVWNGYDNAKLVKLPGEPAEAVHAKP